MKISKFGEIGLINRISNVIKLDKSIIKGIGDDTAVIKYTNDRYLLFTTDMFVEDVHFKIPKNNFYGIGWKAVCANISDIAAMGGLPRYLVVSVGLPKIFKVEWVDKIYKGMLDACKRFDTNLVGGDTVRSKGLVISVALLGDVKKNNLVLRNGAKEGDLIFVTGKLGGSIKGRHITFMPRIYEAQYLVKNFKINSMIDLSDGISVDLNHIAKESNIGAIVYADLIPLSKNAKDYKGALYNGEDFELLFTVVLKEAVRIENKIPKLDTKVTCIGEITKRENGVRLFGRGKKIIKLTPKGFRHF